MSNTYRPYGFTCAPPNTPIHAVFGQPAVRRFVMASERTR